MNGLGVHRRSHFTYFREKLQVASADRTRPLLPRQPMITAMITMLRCSSLDQRRSESWHYNWLFYYKPPSLQMLLSSRRRSCSSPSLFAYYSVVLQHTGSSFFRRGVSRPSCSSSWLFTGGRCWMLVGTTLTSRLGRLTDWNGPH